MSLTIRNLLERLRNFRWRSDIAMKDTEALAALNKIGMAGTPDAVPVVLGFLFNGNEIVATSAAATIEQIVQGCSDLELARLDSVVREMSDWQWSAPHAGDVNRLSHGMTGTLGILSCHRSGYVREAAVQSLSWVNDGTELPFLLIRLNDWVREVRQPAKDAVIFRIRPDYAEHFIRHLPLVFRLEGLSRDNHRDVTERVLRMLASADCRKALHEGLTNADRDVRRTTFRLLLSLDKGDCEVIDSGLRSKDLVIRLIAARAAREHLHGEQLQVALDRMQSDRFAPVRREALYGYVERFPDSALAKVKVALFDPHASMREAARYFCRKLGETGVAAMYRERLGFVEFSLLAVAITGIGEIGVKDDAALVEPLLNHSIARVRKASVRALGRLDAEPHIEQFLSALTDEALGVAKAARDVVQPYLYLVPPQRLGSLFHSSNRPHVRRNILLLMATLPWWNSASLLIAAAGVGDEAIRKEALRYLKDYRRNPDRLSVRPSREQLRLLQEVRDQHAGMLERETLIDLDAHLSYAKREQA